MTPSSSDAAFVPAGEPPAPADDPSAAPPSLSLDIRREP